MVQINTQIVGLKELSRDLKDLGSSFQRVTLRTALRNAIQPVVKGAKDRAPVRTGRLKRSLIGKARVNARGKGEARVIARRARPFLAFHAHLVELGTSQQPARPFLRPAFDAALESGAILRAFVDSINKTIAGRLAKRGFSFREEDVSG